MNAQEIFNKVKNALKEQGGPSTFGSSCQYRGPEGKKCAARVLIIDEIYARIGESLEGQNVSSFTDTEFTEAFGLEFDHVALVIDLQAAHDESVRDWDKSWPLAMERVARKHGLEA